MNHGWHRQGGIGLAMAAAALCLTLNAPAQEPPPTGQKSDDPPAKETTETTPPPADAPGEDPLTEPRTPAQPSAEDIIKAFQQERPQAVPILPAGPEDEAGVRTEPADGDGPKPRPRLPDGAMVFDRVGRVVQEGHWWVFVFESDNPSYPELPMKLLPNQTLERMVRESRGGMDPVVFILTAEVTDFKGENYLLPRKVLRKRDLGNFKK
ncbi:MAG: hypothetical protein IID40_03555 [Planctomycetes bacterium]|nr:hypothetical protein [Planctomycetota bacterium]